MVSTERPWLGQTGRIAPQYQALVSLLGLYVFSLYVVQLENSSIYKVP